MFQDAFVARSCSVLQCVQIQLRCFSVSVLSTDPQQEQVFDDWTLADPGKLTASALELVVDFGQQAAPADIGIRP